MGGIFFIILLMQMFRDSTNGQCEQVDCKKVKTCEKEVFAEPKKQPVQPQGLCECIKKEECKNKERKKDACPEQITVHAECQQESSEKDCCRQKTVPCRKEEDQRTVIVEERKTVPECNCQAKKEICFSLNETNECKQEKPAYLTPPSFSFTSR